MNEDGFRGRQLEAVVFELEVADDLRPEQAADVRRRRYLEAGPQLFRDASAAHDLAALQHQNAQPRARQVSRRHQPVVASPDHDGVITLRHWFASLDW